jgi:hypothetical protein
MRVQAAEGRTLQLIRKVCTIKSFKKFCYGTGPAVAEAEAEDSAEDPGGITAYCL